MLDTYMPIDVERIQALEWVQGRMQDIILDNVTWQVPNPTTKLDLYRVSNAFIFLPVSVATFFESITKALSKQVIDSIIAMKAFIRLF